MPSRAPRISLGATLLSLRLILPLSPAPRHTHPTVTAPHIAHDISRSPAPPLSWRTHARRNPLCTRKVQRETTSGPPHG
eukprot:3873414-Prymnesium_polylepis.1